MDFMGDTTIQSGSEGTVSQVPPATGQAPEETGQEKTQQTAEGTAAEEGTTQVVSEGEAPAEEPPTTTAGESTITFGSESYSSSEPPTSTNTTADSAGLPGAEEGQTIDDWFAKQLEAANKGDPEALKNLQTFMEAPVQETEALAEQIKPQDEFADKESEAQQKRYYDEALYQRDLNTLLAKTAREKALLLPKESPIRQDLLKQSANLMAANKKLDGQIKSYEARQEDAKTAEKSKQYKNLLQLKADGQLTPQQAKKLAAMEKKFGSFKAGEAALYRSKTGGQAKPADSKRGQPQAGRNRPPL